MVVDLDEVGMVEPSNGLGLDAEAALLLGVGMCLRQEHLEGDTAVEPQLARLVDHSHAPAAQHALDRVARHGGPIRGRLGGRQGVRYLFGASFLASTIFSSMSIV